MLLQVKRLICFKHWCF